MPKQWWSSRPMFLAQAGCLLVLFAWSVHHAPGESARLAAPAAAEPARDAAIDNSEDAAADAVGEADARFVAPPTVRFRTDSPPAGSLNLRPLDISAPDNAAPRQPVRPQNPPRRLPPSGPRSPFEVQGSGATVYNALPPEAE